MHIRAYLNLGLCDLQKILMSNIACAEKVMLFLKFIMITNFTQF